MNAQEEYSMGPIKQTEQDWVTRRCANIYMLSSFAVKKSQNILKTR